jgi:hypothetical protein
MQIIVGKTGSILSPTVETNGITIPQFIFEDPKKHKVFSSFDKSDIFNFKTRRTTAHYHKYGVLSSTFKKNNLLKNFYKITSYGVEGKGKVFVSGIEAMKFPFYGFHFQPEKLAWNRKKHEDIIQSTEGISISQKIGNFFINECRKNQNKEIKESELKKLGKININSRDLIKRPENYYWFFNAPKAGLKKGLILEDWRNSKKKPKPKPKAKNEKSKGHFPPDTLNSSPLKNLEKSPPVVATTSEKKT